MYKKKNIIISIAAVILIVILVSTFTYAYFVGRTDLVDVGSDSGELNVHYSVADFDDGTGNVAVSIIPSTSKEGGIKAGAVARINPGSVDALFNLYITPTTIDRELAISALKWEVDVKMLNTDVIIDTLSGDFSKVEQNQPIKIVDGYKLSTDFVHFIIYIWLDSSLLTEPIVDKRFVATLSADTVNVSGDL